MIRPDWAAALTALISGQNGISIPAAADSTPAMDGTGVAGISTSYTRADHVHPSDTSRAPLASPTFTGTPAAPTATVGTNTTQLATTAFVTAAIPAPSTFYAVPLAQGLLIKNNGTTPNTKIDVTAAAAVLTTSGGAPYFWNAGSTFTIDLGSNGAVNKLDAGSIAASTVYHLFLISNGTTTGGLASTSATSPTLPSGYTYSCRVGAMITDGSSNLYRTRQAGRKAQYVVTASTNTAALPRAATGTAGSVTTPTWVAVNLTGIIPATAARVIGNAFAAISTTIVAPNNAYGAYNSASNPPAASASSTTVAFAVPFDLEIESGPSTALYWASSGANGGLFIIGWEDAVSAF